MKPLFRIIGIVALYGTACFGQSLTPRQFTFFNHLLKSIADPMEDPSHGQDATIFDENKLKRRDTD